LPQRSIQRLTRLARSWCLRDVTNHRAFRLPPVASRRQFDRPPLMRFRVVPFSVLGWAVPLKATMLQTIPLRRLIDGGTHAANRFALAVFIASRLRISAISSLETPPARVIRGCVLSATYRAREIGPLSQPVRDFSFPTTLMGFSFPSQLCSALRVRPSFDASHPRAVLPCAWPRVSSSRDCAKPGADR